MEGRGSSRKAIHQGGEVVEKRSIREETEREERVGHGEINGRACYSVITQPS